MEIVADDSTSVCQACGACCAYSSNWPRFTTEDDAALDLIPAKLEGIAVGPDVQQGSTTYHTLWVANDNDFLAQVSDGTETGLFNNPNQFWVFGFTDADLAGSKFVPQQVKF